jgi:indole-3-glycerol phosphate synthase
MSNKEMAPAVRSILDAARERPGGASRVAVDDTRDLPAAFAAAEADGRNPVVAEVKPTSPTTEGESARDPVELAEEMVAGGAAALSVLTEPEHFGGSVENYERVREAVDVPVLRKDFLLTESQLDAVAADVVLLIARFLGDGRESKDSRANQVAAPPGDDLAPMIDAAHERGMQVLVEVHNEAEVEQAVEAGADIIGVNNRDLAALSVDLGTFEEVAPAVPDDATLLAESGISTPADARRMREAGADGLLIGTAIMDGDPEENTRRFVNA